MDLTRRNFLFALVGSVVAAGVPLPVGFSRAFGQSIVAFPEVRAAQTSLNALMVSHNHIIDQLLNARIIVRGESKALVPA